MCNVLAPVVQKVDSAIPWINLYPVDSAIGFPNTYPLDSAIQHLNKSGPGIKNQKLINYCLNPSLTL